MLAGKSKTSKQDDQASITSGADAKSNPGFNENLYFSSEFENQIKTQRTNVCIASAFALGVLAVSLLSTWYLFRTSGPAGTPLEYMKLGPVALSSIALPFPLRMYLSYRVRSPIYWGYKRLFDEAAARGTHVEPHLLEDARAALKAVHKLD